MNMKGRPLPGIADEHHDPRGPRVRRPREIREPERDPDIGERPLVGVGEHAEHVGDADGRHHDRQEEDHAEQVAPVDVLRAEDGEAERQPELHGDADEHVEEGDHQRAGEAAAQRQHQEYGQRTRDEHGDGAPDDADDRRPWPDQITDVEVEQQRIDRTDDQPLDRAQRIERPQQVILLGPEDQLLEVQPLDESELEAAGRELQLGEREVGRDQQRKQRKRQQR